LQEEVSNNLAGLGELGETQFVNNGLRLEYHQYVLDCFSSFFCSSSLGKKFASSQEKRHLPHPNLEPFATNARNFANT